MILKKFLNFWKSEPRDSYKNNSYKKRSVYNSLKRKGINHSYFPVEIRLNLLTNDILIIHDPIKIRLTHV